MPIAVVEEQECNRCPNSWSPMRQLTEGTEDTWREFVYGERHCCGKSDGWKYIVKFLGLMFVARAAPVYRERYSAYRMSEKTPLRAGADERIAGEASRDAASRRRRAHRSVHWVEGAGGQEHERATSDVGHTGFDSGGGAGGGWCEAGRWSAARRSPAQAETLNVQSPLCEMREKKKGGITHRPECGRVRKLESRSSAGVGTCVRRPRGRWASAGGGASTGASAVEELGEVVWRRGSAEGEGGRGQGVKLASARRRQINAPGFTSSFPPSSILPRPSGSEARMRGAGVECGGGWWTSKAKRRGDRPARPGE
ncbi:hypothetical protein C8F04DRAFT_1174786 [Mycena alexandri]|uniref:Uncharacterized protein n=1 Tax=Mycena alexandri TaxID=1745969 RepID=A0AAD6TE78_9AGAR|nr:hypothetical protein C8F04DRAFT_1174786 [Mycena alexandri]